MSKTTLIYQQTQERFTLLEQENQAVDEEEKEQIDLAIYDEFILPEPNPLPKRKRGPREPLRLVYDYPYRMLTKFEGREETKDSLCKSSRSQSARVRARINKEKVEELKLIESIESEESPSSQVYEYFRDGESLVYKIRSNKPETFNRSYCNLQLLKGENQAKTIKYVRNYEDDEYANYYYRPKGSDDGTLVFESRFECGNLAMVNKIGDNEYNLILQNDINTHGYGQWFFFEVKNARPNQKVKFNIINYRKDDSLHNYGMRVLVFSTKKAGKEKVGWSRDGENFYYGANAILRQNLPNRFYRTLSWEYEFKHSDDKVFFAYTHPYTYTDLVEYLDSIEDDEVKSKYFTRSTLCRTVAGNKCEVITIAYHKNPEDCLKKQCIVLTARVHPGETCSSFVIQGVIDFLLSEAKEAQILREHFIFKIVPMLNPDGVIHGNSRCSLEGCDLNRKWKNPSKILHPTIYYTKKLIRRLKQKYGVAFYCDFHGHSKKKDIFLYGCQDVVRSAEARIFPWLLSQNSPLFNYYKCTFHTHPSKGGTSRVVAFKKFKIFNSCTIETSFFGSEKTNSHYTVNDLLNFGSQFSKTLLLYFYKEVKAASEFNEEEPASELKGLFFQREELLKNFYANKSNLDVGAEDDSGSDSEASEDELPSSELQRLMPAGVKLQRSESSRRSSLVRKESQIVSRSLIDKKSPERSPPLVRSPKETQKVPPRPVEHRIFSKHLKSSSLATSKMDSNLLLPIVNKSNKLGSVRNLSLSSSPNYSRILLGGDLLDKEVREGRIFQKGVSIPVPSRATQNYRQMKSEVRNNVDVVQTLKPILYGSNKPNFQMETSFKMRIQEQNSPTYPKARTMNAVESPNRYSANQKSPLKTRTDISHIGFNKMRANIQNERSQLSLKSLKIIEEAFKDKNFSLVLNRDQVLTTSRSPSPKILGGKSSPLATMQNKGVLTDRERRFYETEGSQLGIVMEASKEKLEDTTDLVDSVDFFGDSRMKSPLKPGRKKGLGNIQESPIISEFKKLNKPPTPLPTLQSFMASLGPKEKEEKRRSGNAGLFQKVFIAEETGTRGNLVHMRGRSKSNLKPRPNNLPKIPNSSYHESKANRSIPDSIFK